MIVSSSVGLRVRVGIITSESHPTRWNLLVVAVVDTRLTAVEIKLDKLIVSPSPPPPAPARQLHSMPARRESAVLYLQQSTDAQLFFFQPNCGLIARRSVAAASGAVSLFLSQRAIGLRDRHSMSVRLAS